MSLGFRTLQKLQASQVALVVKIPPASAGDGVDPWVGKSLWRWAWQPIRGEEPGGLQSLGSHREGHD